MSGETSRTTPTVPDYEMLRLIGQGSYGDVWLARGITGIYRAVKVVWRDRFENAEPFEREFRGLRDFASFSLKAEGQMALLHIGRNDAMGFFYYVMELADDAGQRPAFDPAAYVPLTLKEWRQRKGRVPAAEVIAAGAELATALAALHASGLVHRDIKPSNAILVNGKAKLADIGLVAAAHEARTFIGTMGYVPPEGPGSPAADVYALGRVLYELATGLDREDFPKLPAGLERAPDRTELFKLNEVLLRACAPASDARYRDAREMAADLAALRAGHRPKRRRLALAGAAVTLVAALAAGWFFARGHRPESPRTPAPARSIAILPFANLSDDRENGYFADGVYEEVLTNLANLSALRVIARTTMQQYRMTTKPVRQIGAELNVAYVLEGTVRRAGQKVRVAGQLVRVATEETVWSKVFERDLTDVFSLQADLSREIATALQGVLSPGDETRLASQPTTNVDAYDLVQRARALPHTVSDPEKLYQNQKALLEQAVQIDPHYAEAWADLSEVNLGSPEQLAFVHDDAALVAARVALAQAERLDPDNYRVLMAGSNLGAATGDRSMVNQRRKRVAELFPNRAEAQLVAGLTASYDGRTEDALAAFRRAHELDPQNPELLDQLRNELGPLRRYDEYGAVLRELRRLQPDRLELKFDEAVLALRQRGSPAELRAFVDALPANPGGADPALTAFRAQSYFALGDAKGAARLWHDVGSRWTLNMGSALNEMTAVMALKAAGEPVAPEARAALERARDRSRMVLAKDPTNVHRWNMLSLSLVLLGETDEARTALAHTREINRVTPSGEGRDVQYYNGIWRAWFGEKAEAIAQIAPLLRGRPPTLYAYANEMRHSIFTWPLHGDPAFEALLDDPANNAPVELVGRTPVH